MVAVSAKGLSKGSQQSDIMNRVEALSSQIEKGLIAILNRRGNTWIKG